MKLESIRNAVTSKIGRQILIGKKNSPTILFASGVIGVVATTVLASRATLRLEEVLIETHADFTKAKDVRERHAEKYSDTDYRKDMTYIYIRTAVKITKLYGPAIIVGGLSIASLTGAHNILTKRNAALTAAYAAVEKGFAEYRQRVVDEYGPEKDREFRFGKETREVLVEDTNGPKKKQVTHHGTRGNSIYARLFDENNKNWNHNPEYNMLFLRGQQNYANDRLQAKGYLMLNDVYDMLGLPRTTAGQVVGWLKDGNGNGFVDFGVFDNNGNVERFYEFMVGRENALLLDFNVDGPVYQQLDKI